MIETRTRIEIRVITVRGRIISALAPDWSTSRGLRIPIRQLPKDLRSDLQKDGIMSAEANTSAKFQEELHLGNFLKSEV